MSKGTIVVDETVVIGIGPLVNAILGQSVQTWVTRVHENKDSEFDFLLSDHETAERHEREYQERRKRESESEHYHN